MVLDEVESFGELMASDVGNVGMDETIFEGICVWCYRALCHETCDWT